MPLIFEDRQNRVQFPYQPNIIFTLAPKLKVLKARVILAGQVVISAGTTNGTIVGEGGPIELIERIQLYANRTSDSRYPGGRIVDCTARALLRYATIEHQGKFVGDLLAATLGNGAAGTYTIYTSVPIYFADSTLLNQMSTALNMDNVDSQKNGIYSSVQVNITLSNSLTSCFSGNDRTVNFTGLTVQWVDDRLAITDDTVPVLQEDHYTLIGAQQTRMIDPAMPVDGAFTRWLVMAEQGITTRTLSQALVNRITALGQTLNFDEYANDIQQDMIDDGFFDPSQSLTGQFFIDWTKGSLMTSNPAQGLDVKFDVNNPSGSNLDQLHIYTRRIFGLS